MANRDNMIAFIERTTGYRYGETVGTLKTADAHTGEEIYKHLRRRMAYFAIDANNIEEIILAASNLAWNVEELQIEKNQKAVKFQKLGTPKLARYLNDCLDKNYSRMENVYQDEMVLMEKVLVSHLQYSEDTYTIGFVQNWIGYAHLYLYALLMLNEREEVAKYKNASFFKYATIPCNDLISARISKDFGINLDNDIPFMECNNADTFRDWNNKVMKALGGNMSKLEYSFS